MTWTPIASLTLSTSWQLLAPDLIEGQLFRISQSWDTYPTKFKGLIAASFSASIPYDFYNIRAFYPSTNQKILQLLIPAELQAAGITSRYILMKYHSRRLFTANWLISVEKFTS